MYHGVINVYKEKGFTSHDAVAKLRGILKQKKIGHTGTLDPNAVGVLPVCLGMGTKLCDMLTDTDKTYEAVLLLGTSTDTQDTTGTVLEQKEPCTKLEQIEQVIASFCGEYEQIPPMYSAIKVNGKKLYELARNGIEIERKPRKIFIQQITILEENLPRVRMRIECSKGTYIRTLCHDIGQALGCGGCMEELTRTKAGMFCVKESLTIEEIKELKEQGNLEQKIVQVEEIFLNLPCMKIAKPYERLIYNGNAVSEAQLEKECGIHNSKIRMYDASEKFIGIYQWNIQKNLYYPVKMFLE